MTTSLRVKKNKNKALVWLTDLRVPLFFVLIQSFIIYLQVPLFSGDDPIRVSSLVSISNGEMPLTKFSIIHPGIFSFFYKLLNVFNLGDVIINHSGALLWLCWGFIMCAAFKKHRSTKFITAAITFSYCSMLAPYLVGFNTEVFSALLVSAGLALVLLCNNKLSRISGWALVILATANIPITFIAGCFLSLYFVIVRRRLRFLLYPLAVLLLIVLEASIFRGHFSFSKYSLAKESGTFTLLPWDTVTAFGYPVFFGVLAILFSFGRGLVFYLPTLVMSFHKKTDAVGQWITAQLVFLLCLVPVYGAWWAWYGGVSFGPRFFILGCIIGSFSAAEILFKNKLKPIRTSLSLVAIAWSGWVAIAGVSYYITPKVAFLCMKDDFRLEPFCWYSPEYSTIFAPFWEGGPVTWRAKIFTLSVLFFTLFVLRTILTKHLILLRDSAALRLRRVARNIKW